jgi:PST family polysaccharide transporter
MAGPIDYFSDESLHRDLRSKTIRGGAATGLAQAFVVAIQFVSIPFLARLLTPADFGVVEMVTVVTSFAAMFVDAGLSMATIQRERITHQQVSNVFWFATGCGLFVAVLVAALAPGIAWFYGETRLIPIALIMSLTFILAGLTVQHRALLRRTMQYRHLAISQVASVATGQAAAVAWAWWFRNYWALVVMNLVFQFTQMVLSWWLCHWRPALFRRRAGSRELIMFGANLTGFNMLNFLSRNADNVLIGRVWGDTALGLYGRAYKLLLYPLQHIHGPISTVVLPTLSRLYATSHDRYRNAYTRINRLISVLVAPAMGFAAVMSEPIVRIVFGPQWSAAAPILTWLAITGVFQITLRTNGWLFVSQGRVREMFHLGVYTSTNTVAFFFAGLPWGPVGVAMAYAISGIVTRVPVVIWWAGRKGPVNVRDQVDVLARSVGLSILVGAAAWATKWLIDRPGTWQEFVACSLAAGCVYGIGLFSPLSGGIIDDLQLLRDAFNRRKAPAEPDGFSADAKAVEL